MVRVKICGITNAGDASAAVEYGADALGFVFYPKSPRFVTPEIAQSIIGQLPPCIATFGVFVNETPNEIRRICTATGIGIVQLHGDEPASMCTEFPRVVKAFRVRAMSDLQPLGACEASAYLLDTYDVGEYGGTGQVFNWDIAVEAKQFGRIILAGGLTPDNIAQAVVRVRPYAVDVSSGVEKEKGKKDLEKMRLFIERAKAANR